MGHGDGGHGDVSPVPLSGDRRNVPVSHVPVSSMHLLFNIGCFIIYLAFKGRNGNAV